MNKKLIAGVSAVAAALLVGGAYFAATPATEPEPTTVVSVIEARGAASAPEIVIAPIPEPTIAAPIVIPPAGPTLCPDGWFAQSVDGEGNESNCLEGSGGQPCIAYDADNNCTAYYKP